MTVAQTRHRGAAGGVEIAFAVAVEDVQSFSTHRDRQVGFRVAMEYVPAC
jgi:hypothetical protein